MTKQIHSFKTKPLNRKTTKVMLLAKGDILEINVDDTQKHLYRMATWSIKTNGTYKVTIEKAPNVRRKKK